MFTNYFSSDNTQRRKIASAEFVMMYSKLIVLESTKLFASLLCNVYVTS